MVIAKLFLHILVLVKNNKRVIRDGADFITTFFFELFSSKKVVITKKKSRMQISENSLSRRLLFLQDLQIKKINMASAALIREIFTQPYSVDSINFSQTRGSTLTGGQMCAKSPACRKIGCLPRFCNTASANRPCNLLKRLIAPYFCESCGNLFAK